MNNAFKLLILPALCSVLLPGMTHAAASSSIEEVQNKIKHMTQLIESRIPDFQFPTNEFLRMRLINATAFDTDTTGTSFLGAKATFLEDINQVINIIQQKDEILGYQALINNMHSHVLDQSLAHARSRFKQINSGAFGAHATIATFEQLIEKAPTTKAESRQFLHHLLQEIERQSSIMKSVSKIADVLSEMALLSEKIQSMYTDNLKFQSWLVQMSTSDPNIIAIKLKNVSEFLEMIKNGRVTAFSNNLCTALLDTNIPELTLLAHYNLTCVQKTELYITLMQLSNSIATRLNKKKSDLTFTAVPSIKQLEQPTYFANTALTLLTGLAMYNKKLTQTGIPNSKEELEKSTLNLVMIENSMIKLVQNYKAQEESLKLLQEQIRHKLTPDSQSSLIDPRILRGTNKASSRVSKKRKPAPAPMLIPAPSSSCTPDLTEPVAPICSSSNDLPPTPIQPISKTTPARKTIEENLSMIRIQDAYQEITIALFKLEKPTAQSISSCRKTHAINLWQKNADDALQENGYLDKSHKNYTPSPTHRTRMKQYHGFSELADDYVTQCAVTQNYRKADGTVHTMICMPGALYFADCSYQVGIFTYLIDPANNQMYHRMFHECSGEKIVKEYQARGYWDIDPELGPA